jgi:hypothetical protein
MIKRAFIASSLGICIVIAVGAFWVGFWSIGTVFNLLNQVLGAEVVSERAYLVEGMLFYGIVALFGIIVGFISLIALIIIYFLRKRVSL